MPSRLTSASRATQELRHDGLHLARHGVGSACRLDQPHALGLGALDLEVATPDAAMERQGLLLEAIEAPALDALQPVLGPEIEEQSEAGDDAARRAQVHVADQ